MTSEVFKSIGIIAGLFLSALSLIIHWKNSRLQRKSYLMSLHASKTNSTTLDVIESKQFEGYFVVKLAFYNPGSTAAILRALLVEKTVPHSNFFLKRLGFNQDIRVDCKWSPEVEGKDYEVFYLNDAYQLLHVKAVATLYVSIPGCIENSVYHFQVKTNQNYYRQSCCIPTGKSYFYSDYNEW